MNGNQFCNPATISLLALRPDAPNRCSADLDSNSCATSIERETRRAVQTRPASALCFNHLARTAHKKRKRFAVLWACWGSTPQWSFNAIHYFVHRRAMQTWRRQGHKNLWDAKVTRTVFGSQTKRQMPMACASKPQQSAKQAAYVPNALVIASR